MNKLSLCITCFDGDFHLLDGLLESFKQQTENPDEIIISASGLDKSLLSKYNSIFINNVDVPIKIVCDKERHYQSVARNLGAKKASHDIILFFDVDDTPHPQKLEITKIFFKSLPDTEILIHSYTKDIKKFKDVVCFNIYDEFIKSGYGIEVKDNRNLPIHHAHIACRSHVFNNIKFLESKSAYRLEDSIFISQSLDFALNIKYIDLELVKYS